MLFNVNRCYSLSSLILSYRIIMNGHTLLSYSVTATDSSHKSHFFCNFAGL